LSEYIEEACSSTFMVSTDILYFSCAVVYSIRVKQIRDSSFTVEYSNSLVQGLYPYNEALIWSIALEAVIFSILK
jgi:hypothetical protein